MGMATTSVYGSPHPRVRVLVADDHEVMRMGIRTLFSFAPAGAFVQKQVKGRKPWKWHLGFILT